MRSVQTSSEDPLDQPQPVRSGEELDAQIIYMPTRQSQIGAGYGHIFTGEFLKKTTKGVDYNYPYMLVEYVF